MHRARLARLALHFGALLLNSSPAWRRILSVLLFEQNGDILGFYVFIAILSAFSILYSKLEVPFGIVRGPQTTFDKKLDLNT